MARETKISGILHEGYDYQKRRKWDISSLSKYMPWLNQNSTLNKNKHVTNTIFVLLKQIIAYSLTYCKLHYIFNDVTLFW